MLTLRFLASGPRPHASAVSSELGVPECAQTERGVCVALLSILQPLPRALVRALPPLPPLAPCHGDSLLSSRVSLLVALRPSHDASCRIERLDSAQSPP